MHMDQYPADPVHQNEALPFLRLSYGFAAASGAGRVPRAPSKWKSDELSCQATALRFKHWQSFLVLVVTHGRPPRCVRSLLGRIIRGRALAALVAQNLDKVRRVDRS